MANYIFTNNSNSFTLGVNGTEEDLPRNLLKPRVNSTNNQILEIDPSDSSVNFLGDPSVITLDANKWYSDPIYHNGKIYQIPASETRVIEVNPEDGSINFYDTGIVLDSKFPQKSILTDEGFIVLPYMFPDLYAARALLDAGAAGMAVPMSAVGAGNEVIVA